MFDPHPFVNVSLCNIGMCPSVYLYVACADVMCESAHCLAHLQNHLQIKCCSGLYLHRHLALECLNLAAVLSKNIMFVGLIAWPGARASCATNFKAGNPAREGRYRVSYQLPACNLCLLHLFGVPHGMQLPSCLAWSTQPNKEGLCFGLSLFTPSIYKTIGEDKKQEQCSDKAEHL
jgi:hypothetical protein